jgi:hypothetical protein
MWYLHLLRFAGDKIDDLPDKPRLGLSLMATGLFIEGVWFAWRRLSPLSFATASEFFSRLDDAIPLSTAIFMVGLATFAIGLFVFFRRLVWWLQEKRAPIILNKLDLK